MFKNNNYSSRKSKGLKILFFGVVFIGFVAALAWVVMFLWNAILPDVAGVKPLTFWQSAGLLILAKILFGGLGRFGGRRGGWRDKWKGMSREERQEAKSRWKEKWMGMDKEERQEAKSRWKEYCRKRDSTDNKES